jgi:hypothetical protein
MSRVRYWSHLAGCVALAGCGSGATQVAPTSTDGRAAATAPKVPAQMNYFHCDEYPGPEHYVDRCAVRFKLNTAKAAHWTRLGCFGEIKFTQVHEGQVLSPRQGFYEGACKRNRST